MKTDDVIMVISTPLVEKGPAATVGVEGGMPGAQRDEGDLGSVGASGWLFWLGQPAVQIILILLVGLAIYMNTLHAPFILDDNLCIVKNPAIRNLKYFIDFELVQALHLPADAKHSFVLRPFVYFTFALNYLVAGVSVFGFHLVNTAIHLGNAVLVYLLVTVTLRQAPRRADGTEVRGYHWLPLLAALLFVIHPLQTQAVTYIVQRFTSLACGLYLLSLLLYIRARTATTATRRWCSYGLALLAAILAMHSKEIAFTLPVIMLLYDGFFLPGRFRQRLVWLLPFFLTMAIIPLALIGLTQVNSAALSGQAINDSIDLVNFAQVSRWDYLMTQFSAIVNYLRLFFVPIGQNFDHDYRLARSFFEPRVVVSLFMLLTLFGTAAGLAVRSFREAGRYGERLIAFGILWFFVTLSVESSIIPIDDLFVEYRAYLPSFGIILAVVASMGLALGRGIISPRTLSCAAIVGIMVLGTATIARNSLYRDPIALYRDIVAKSPDKARGHSLLGVAYLVEDRLDEALGEFNTVLRLRPDDAYTMVNLGGVYFGRGEFALAIRQFERSLALAPDNYLAHGNLGLSYLNINRMDEAERELLAALAINANFREGRSALAHLYEILGRKDEAIVQYRTLLGYFPKDQDARERLQILTMNR